MRWILHAVLSLAVLGILYWGWGQWQHIKGIKDLKARTIENMIVLPGGDFTSGNYRTDENGDGPWAGAQGLKENIRPPQTTHLTSFALSAYETRTEDFALYLAQNKLPPQFIAQVGNWGHDGYSASISWSEAVAYCHWLGELTDLPIRLPTEDEWEFAARYRLGRATHATDNGLIERGRNAPVASRDDPNWNPSVGSFPPTPAGFYDMAAGNYEWVSDHETDDIRIMKGGSDVSSIEYEPIPSRFVAKPLAINEQSLKLYGDIFRRYKEMGQTTAFLSGGTARCAVDAAPLEAMRRRLKSARMP